jgi:hypothetical protein
VEEGFRAGAGRRTIEIAGALPFDGFTGVHDPLEVRVAILENGSERLALAVLDLVSLPPDIVQPLRETIAQAAELHPDSVVACVTHTFGSPHLPPADGADVDEAARAQVLRSALLDAVRDATAEARRGLRRARLGYGHGISGVNVNREVLTADGWWHGVNEAGVRDQMVGVVRIDDLAGSPIVILVNYPVQSSVMHQSRTRDGGQLVTADLAGAAVRHIEAQYSEADPVALFFIGCAADQGPFLSANRHVLDRNANVSRRDIHEHGFLIVDLLGERLGQEVVRVCEAVNARDLDPVLRILGVTLTLPAQVPPRDFRALGPSTAYDFLDGGQAPAPVVVARIGKAAFVGVQVELSCSTGMDLKQLSPFPLTMVANLVNGGAKYMVDESGYERVTYGAMNSWYARGAAELLTRALADLLAEVAAAQAQAH